MRIGIIGDGNVGGALQRGLSRAGHDVRATGREGNEETARWGEVVILAVPFGALDDVARKIADRVGGKVVVDPSNALTQDMQLALGYSTSGAEELQKKLPGARVVKCFNTVFAQHMDSGHVEGEQLTVFCAGDDDAARKTVLSLARDIGFDAVDGGPLRNARSLEALGFFNIQLGYALGLGSKMGLKLVHEATT
jgi:predicted dinucleotide-binding enzyme